MRAPIGYSLVPPVACRGCCGHRPSPLLSEARGQNPLPSTRRAPMLLLPPYPSNQVTYMTICEPSVVPWLCVSV